MTTSSTPPAVGMVATRSSMSSGPNFLNLILPSWLALLGNIQVAHDLQARRERGPVARRHLDVGLQVAILAEADLGLRLAGIGLDMNIRHALVIGIDDDLVDQLHQLIVGRGRNIVRIGTFYHLSGFVGVQAGEHVADIAGICRLGAVELVDRFPEFLLRGDLVDQLGLREYVRGDARAADPLRIQAEDGKALFGLVNRQPLIGLDVFALQVLQQIRRLDAVSLERLIRRAEEFREGRADRRNLHLELVDEHHLNVDGLLARLARRQLELPGREHRIGDQIIVLGLDHLRLLPLLECDRERLR